MQTVKASIVNRAAPAGPAAARAPVPARVDGRSAVRVQRSLRVSSPADPAEKEADATAKKVMRMAIPQGSVALTRGGVFRQIGEKRKEKEELLRRAGEGEREKELRRQVKEKERDERIRRSPESPYVARFAGSGLLGRKPKDEKRRDEEVVRRKAEGVPDASANVAAEIQNSLTAGEPLPLSVRRFMEPRFRADFSGVRVHTDERAASLSRRVNARAFAFGNHLFFGRDQFRPESDEGRELIAHELTHTIQQGGAVQRAEEPTVSQQSPPQVQRLGISDALDYIADKANIIPGFRMFTIVIGVNPINMSRVDRSAANVLRAVIEFIPGGGLITQALENYGVFDRVGAWVEQQIRSLGMVGSMFRDALMRFLDSLGWRDIFRLGSVWDRAKRIFTEPIGRIIDFARGLVTGILRLIKDAILRPLAGLAQNTRGYDLLRAVLGQDPITGDPYPRNADTLIGGFMKLIGQEEVWENIKRANAIARAWAWFQGALSGLLGFVRQIPTLFLRTLQSLGIADIVVLPRAFAKVVGLFAGIVGRFFSWAGSQVMQLLQIIFEVVAPGAMPYLRRIRGAFSSIIRNPIGFVRNLVRAGLLGFRNFARNFLTHLRTSLIGWLTGTMAGTGIYVPQAFSLQEIIKFVLSVLGLTWQNLRQRLVRILGERAVAALETGFELVRTLVTQGPAAAWEQIQQGITNLREMVMEQIMSFVQSRIVQAAITRLLTSLNPAGAFVQAVIAIYNTIMFFVERLRQISQVAMAFLNSMAAIASGAIAAAANRVEQTMGGLLTLVISFLARLVGLGRVSEAVSNIIARIRAPIDRALDRVVDWIVAQARRLGRLIAGGARRAAGAVMGWLGLRKRVRLRNREEHTLYFARTGNRTTLMIATDPVAFTAFLNSIRNVPPALRPDRESALRYVAEIARLEADTQATNADHTERIQLLLEELGRITVELMNSSVAHDVRTTDPTFAGLSRGGFGAGMRVMLVTNELRRGTRPRVSGNPAFDALNRRQTGEGSYYVLGHLLSEKLGGPGTDWRNLTPLSRSGNREHEHKVESIIKPTTGDTPRAFLYVVTPSYGRPVNRSLIARIQMPTNPESQAAKDAKEAIVTAEQHVPTSMVCSISEIDPLSGQPAGIRETYTIPNVIDQSSPGAYEL